MASTPTVLVSVEGGIAEVSSDSDRVDILVWDWDNFDSLTQFEQDIEVRAVERTCPWAFLELGLDNWEYNDAD